MSEPLRTSPASHGSADADREALIERLLLAGLDHYFDGRYEQAVNVWTRVAFLERGHGRARAYIDRARGAIAERQRLSEELLHRGVDAYRSGELSRARDLLTKAASEGGSETAILFLQRLGIAEAGRAVADDAVSTSDELNVRARTRALRQPEGVRRTSWVATIAASAVVAGAILLGAQPIASWLGDTPLAQPTVNPPVTEPLPILRRSEMQLTRARELYGEGHLRDALRVLGEIDAADPLRVDADALTTRIQTELIAESPALTPADRPNVREAVR
jgi:hypothetical protein